MMAIDVYFESRERLRDHIRDAEPASGLTINGENALRLGTPVLVRVSARGLPGDVTFEGTVCSESSSPARVTATPAHRARFEFLCRWAHGTAETVTAREDRLAIPSRLCEVRSALAEPVTDSALMLEVSESGARIAVRRALPASTHVVLAMRSREVITELNATVAWSRNGMAGLSLDRDKPAERDVWLRWVGEQRNALAWSVSSASVRQSEEARIGSYAVVDREAVERRRAKKSCVNLPAQRPPEPAAEPRRETLPFGARHDGGSRG